MESEIIIDLKIKLYRAHIIKKKSLKSESKVLFWTVLSKYWNLF